jgi:hypothetical protein
VGVFVGVVVGVLVGMLITTFFPLIDAPGDRCRVSVSSLSLFILLLGPLMIIIYLSKTIAFPASKLEFSVAEYEPIIIVSPTLSRSMAEPLEPAATLP